jgi:hypothetical protein
MANFDRLSEQIFSEARKWDQLLEAAEELKRAGGLQNVIDEKTAELKRLQADEAEARAAVADVRVKAAAAKKAAGANLDKALAERDRILKDAKVRADKIIQGAEAQAAQMLADARTKQADIEDRAKRMVEAVRGVQ